MSEGRGCCYELSLWLCFLVYVFVVFVVIVINVNAYEPFIFFAVLLGIVITNCFIGTDDNDLAASSNTSALSTAASSTAAPSNTAAWSDTTTTANITARGEDAEDIRSTSNQERREKRREYLLQSLIIKTIVSNEYDDKTDNQVRLCDVIKGKFKHGTKELETCPDTCTISLEQSLSLDASSSLNESAINDDDDDDTSIYADEENAITEDDIRSTVNDNKESAEDGLSQPKQYVGLSPQLATLVRMTPTDESTNARTGIINSTTSHTRNERNINRSSLQSYDGNISSIRSSMRSLFGNTAATGKKGEHVDTLCCPICLDEFQIGDEVCWSKNEKCLHIHHLDCMMNWLLDHDDCPLCRQKFV